MSTPTYLMPGKNWGRGGSAHPSGYGASYDRSRDGPLANERGPDAEAAEGSTSWDGVGQQSYDFGFAGKLKSDYDDGGGKHKHARHNKGGKREV